MKSTSNPESSFGWRACLAAVLLVAVWSLLQDDPTAPQAPTATPASAQLKPGHVHVWV